MTPRAQKPAALVPSDVSAWGGEPAQKEHALPTGRVMTLRRGPSMRRLVMQGVVPSSLLGVELVERSDPNEGGVNRDDGNGGVVRVYELNSVLFEKHRAAVVCAMAVQPPVVMEPLPGALLYDDLDDQEVDYIVTWTQEGLAGTARFLVVAGSDADGEGGEGVGEVAE